MRFSEGIIRSIVNLDSPLYDIVYLYGDRAAVFAQVEAILKEYRGSYPHLRILRTDGERFAREHRQNALGGKMPPLPECDLYVFENIEEIAGRETAEQQLYGILDHQLETGRRILVTGAEPVAHMDILAPRICAQLSGGVSFCAER